MAFDPFAEEGGASAPFDPFATDAAPAKKQNKGIIADLGTDLKRGAQQIPGAITGLADIPVAGIVGRPLVSDAAQKIGEITGFQPGKWAKSAEAEYSPSRQAGRAEVDTAWENGTASDIAGAYLKNPMNIVGAVAESLPSMVAGGLAGRAALGVGSRAVSAGAGGVGPALPGVIARTVGTGLAPAVGAGIGEGGIMAGQAMQNSLDAGVDPRTAAGYAGATGLVGGALGAIGGKVAQKLGVVDPETLIAGGIGRQASNATGIALAKETGKRMAAGAISEGLFEELPQSVFEQGFQNLAQDKPLTEGMARAGVEGALAGSFMGGAFNAIPGGRYAESKINAQAKPQDEQQPIAGLLPPPTYTGTPGGQIVENDAARQAAIDAADKNAAELYAMREAFEKSRQGITLVADPVPVQQRIDAMLGLDTTRMDKKGRALYEKDLAAAFNEPIGITLDANQREVPFTMGEYLDSQVKADDAVRARERIPAQTANQQASNRLTQLADEEAQQHAAITQDLVRSAAQGGALSKAALTGIQTGATQMPVHPERAAIEQQMLADEAAQAELAPIERLMRTRSDEQVQRIAENENANPKMRQVAIADLQRRMATKAQPTTTSPLQQAATQFTPPSPSIKMLQTQLDKTEPFSEASQRLTGRLQTAVSKDAQKAINNGEIPVYRVTDHVSVAIHPSAQNPGMVQVTRYTKDGVIGDSQYNNIDEAVTQEGLTHKPRIPSGDAIKAIEQSIAAEAEYQQRKGNNASQPSQMDTQAPQANGAQTRVEQGAAPQGQGVSNSSGGASDIAKGAQGIAQRQANAANNFIDSVQEQFGLSKEDAGKAWDHFVQNKLVKIDAVGGQYSLTDGRLWDGEVMRRAASGNQEPAKSKPDRRQIDATKDTLFQAIAKLGGMDTQELTSNGFDPKDITYETAAKVSKKTGKLGKKSRLPLSFGFNMPLHKKGGMSFDGMLEALKQYGYFPEGATKNDAIEAFRRELGGDLVVTPDAEMRRMEEDQAARDAEQLAEQEANDAIGYDDLNEREKALVDFHAETVYDEDNPIEAFRRGMKSAGATEEEINEAIKQTFGAQEAGDNDSSRAAQGTGKDGNAQGVDNGLEDGSVQEGAEPDWLTGQTNEQAAAELAKRKADIAEEKRQHDELIAKNKRESNAKEKARRAAQVLAEREAAKKAEVDKAAEDFALGQAAPAPVDRKVTTEDARGQQDMLAQAKYAGPADVSSRAGQMELSNRAGTIAALKGMNEQLRKIAPDEAWADRNIEDAQNLDALRDQISQALVDANRGKPDVNPLRKELEELSGQELKDVFSKLNLAGKLMAYEERISALLMEDAAEVRAAISAVTGNPSESTAQPVKATTEAKAVEPAQDGDWLSALFNQGTDSTKEDTKAVAQAVDKSARVDAAIAMLTGEIEANNAVAAELAARKYKKNRKQIELVGDGPGKNGSMSISAINESRRRRSIEAAQNTTSAMKKAIEFISENPDDAFKQVLDMESAVTKQFNEGFFGKSAKIEDQLDMAVGSLIGASQYSGVGSAGRKLRMAAHAYFADDKPAAVDAKKEAETDDGIRYSKSAKQEDDPTLIIQHNLSADNLLHAIKMGGIPVPSLAVTDKAHPMTSFGEITLIGSKDMADPKGYAGTKVFGADIYSPRYPRITYRVTRKATDKLDGKLANEREMTGAPYISADDIANEGVRTLETNGAIMAQFLKEKGIEPRIVRNAVKPLPDAIEAFKNDTRHAHELSADPEFVDAAWKAHEAVLVKAYDGDVEAAKAEIEQQKENGENRGVDYITNQYARELIAYQRNVRENGKPDRYRSESAMTVQIDVAGLNNEYKNYVAGVFESLNPEEKIFKGYTETGARYAPHTLENVVKILKSDLRGGENFNYGVGSLRAKFTPQFRSVEQIRQAKNRLMDKPAFEAVKKEIESDLEALSNSFGLSLDQTIGMLEDAPKMGLQKAAETYNSDIEISNSMRQQAGEFLTRLKNLPTEYFEAKILRNVDLAEFSGAIVPEGVNPKVIDALKSRGITDIRTYKRGEETSRREAIVSLADDLHAQGKNTLFSKADSAQSQPITRAEAESRIKSILGDKLGKVLIDSGIVTFTNKGSEYQGATYKDGSIALNLDALNADNFAGVLQHEGFHSTIRDLVGEQTYTQMMKRLDTMLAMGKGAQWVKDADAAIPSDTKAEHRTEEIAAYSIEQYVNGAKQPNIITRWVESLLSALRTAIIRRLPMGKLKSWAINNIRPQDLANLAIAGLKAKAQGQLQAQGREAMAFSNNNDINRNGDAFYTQISGNEIGRAPGATIQEKASNWMRANLQGKSFKNDMTGWDISVGRKGINKSLMHASKDVHARSVTAIPSLLNNAVLVYSEQNNNVKERESIPLVHHFYAPLIVGSREYIARMVVKEATDGRRFYDYETSDEISPAVSDTTLPFTQRMGAASGARLTMSMGKLLSYVKKEHGGTDPKFSTINQTDTPAFNISGTQLAGGSMMSRTEGLSETINVDGIERPTSNSNGNPIAQTDEGLRNFWRWFSPSPSQLIDGLSISSVSRLKRDSEALADFVESQSGISEADRFAVIPSSVFAHVASAVNNDKVLDAVIRSLPVDVVNFLGGKKGAAKNALHDAAVLEKVFSVYPASNVTLGVNPSLVAELLVRMVANAGAKITGLTDGPFKRNSAVLADTNDPILGAHVRKSPNGNLSIISGFGDSKVVDAEGRPLVVYHGTDSDFNVFSDSKPNFFSASKLYSTAYGKKTVPVYLSIEMPFDPANDGKARDIFNNEFRNDPLGRGAPVLKDGQSVPFQWADELFGFLYEREHIRENVEFDGIVVDEGHITGTYGEEGRKSWVPLDNYQIKSAIGNNGNFDGTNPDIRFSRAQIIGDSGRQSAFDIPEQSRLDDVIYAMQDKQVDLRRVVQSIKRAGGNLTDSNNAYLQEELFHGRASKGVHDFLNNELRPLVAQMRSLNVEMADFEEYLWNKHAEERNKQIAKINDQMPDGGSGIKTADAKAYLQSLTPAKKSAYEALAKRINKINLGSQAILVSSGLEKQETIDAWNGAYSNYVPLHREDVDTGHVGTGKGYSIRGSASKRAVGSNKPVVDILANLAMQRERNIVRAEKNRVSNALYGLAVANPNADLWQVDESPTERVVVNRGGKDEVVTRIVPGFRQQDNVIHTRINGEDHFVIMDENNPRSVRMAQAIKNLDMDQLGKVLSNTAKATRYMAAINTQFNPVFGVVNLARDTQGAMLNLSTTPLAGQQKKVLKYTLSALRGIYADLRDTRNGKAPSSAWEQEFEEFQKAGGQTGYRDQYSNAAERADAIAKELKSLDRNWLLKRGGAMFDWLSDYNESMENAVRLASFKAAKESGMSVERAASLAKNLTVNFNRKGQVATQMGALYSFFNASVQGTARLAETMAGPMGKKILYGGLLLGSMQAMLLAASGMGDDEPPEFVRERSIIIPIGDGKYVSIPMPLGFHVIPNLSRIPTEFVMSGFKDPAKRIADMVGLFADTFNPIGNSGLSLQTIAPTVIDPLAALSENRDWTGKPIAKLDRDSLNPTPGYLRAKDTATSWSRAISYGFNLLSGGTDHKKGLFSPTPDQIDYLIGQATGGVGREVSKAEQTGMALATGEDLPMHKIPLFGRFIGDTTGQSAEGGKFYASIQRINEHENEIKGLREKKDADGVREYIKDNPEAMLVVGANHVEREIQKLKAAKREAVKADNTERVKAIESQITSRMKMFNERVRSLSEKNAA